MIITVSQGLNFLEISFVISFILSFVIGVITSRIEIQYKLVKTSSVFVLVSRASIIHPRLKIEERAIISKIVLVVICKALPIRVDKTIEAKIRGFIINMSR